MFLPEAGPFYLCACRLLWLTHPLVWSFSIQVACYQTRLEVAADTLSSCHVGIGEAVFDPEAARVRPTFPHTHTHIHHT